MRLSIIIPCYNMGKYLVRCLQSIVNENLTDFEVICVNDGSTDNTEQIFKEFKYTSDGKDKYPWLKMIYQDNQGLSGARNTGMNHAKGEYFSFVDPDDEIINGGHRKLLELATQYNSPDLLVGTMVVVRENGEKRLYNPGNKYWVGENAAGDAYIRLSSCSLHCTMSSKLYKSSVIRQSGLQFSRSIVYAEDACFNAQLLPFIQSVVVSPVEVYMYRFNDVSISAKFKGQRYVDSRMEMNHLWRDFIKKYVPEKNLDEVLAREDEGNSYGWLAMIYMVYRDRSVRKRYSWLKKICQIAHAENPQWRQYFKYGLPKYIAKSMSVGLPVTHVMLSVCCKIPAIRRRFR